MQLLHSRVRRDRPSVVLTHGRRSSSWPRRLRSVGYLKHHVEHAIGVLECLKGAIVLWLRPFLMNVSPAKHHLAVSAPPAAPRICDGRGPPLQEELSVDFGVMQKLIECVPNISEGRDQNLIRQITEAIDSLDGVSPIDIYPLAIPNASLSSFKLRA